MASLAADPLQIALDAAREAAATLLEHAHLPLEITEKGRRADIVTAADRASEAVILRKLRAAYPNASILAEEGGAFAGTSDERWIVDPLDGTTNYAHGYPIYSIAIAFERGGELIAGVVLAPALNECFAAERGAGATRNDRAMATSPIDHVANALVCTGFHPADFARNAHQFARASERAQGVRRDGSAALDLAYTACGRFDGFWEFDLSPWDVAAGALIVREAGGAVSTVDGREFAVDARSVLATNGHIHDELISILREP